MGHQQAHTLQRFNGIGEYLPYRESLHLLLLQLLLPWMQALDRKVQTPGHFNKLLEHLMFLCPASASRYSLALRTYKTLIGKELAEKLTIDPIRELIDVLLQLHPRHPLHIAILIQLDGIPQQVPQKSLTCRVIRLRT